MKSRPLVQRFWEGVHVSPEGCWEWIGSKDTYGYGIIFDNERKKPRLVHRLAWEYSFGDIPNGMNVCHKCDNRSCSRPDHLFLGTQKDNMADCTRKGRKNSPFGESHSGSKLKTADVIRIRNMRGVVTCASLARSYSVSPPLISYIQLGKAWRKV